MHEVLGIGYCIVYANIYVVMTADVEEGEGSGLSVTDKEDDEDVTGKQNN